MELVLGRFTLLTDPMFSTGTAAFVMNGHPSTGEDYATIARAGEVPELDLDTVDGVVVSHLHSDHFDREARDRLPKDLRVVAPEAQAARLGAWGFRFVQSLEWWKTFRMEAEGERLLVTAVPARHAVDDAANEMLGVVNGYVIRHRRAGDEFALYWTGDTVWFDGLHDIRRRMGDIHLVVPHIGAVGRDGPWGRMTLDAAEARQLLDLFAPAQMVPIHHHTFSHYVEPVDALEALLVDPIQAARLRTLREGEAVDLP
jgi:L-ascorbate metabolism protein UlaG (beta-lactamase superfamily)